jgi:hypothetical protein
MKIADVDLSSQASAVAKQYMSKNTALAAKIYAVSMIVEGNALRDLSDNRP